VAKGSAKGEEGAEQLPIAEGAAVASELWADEGNPPGAYRAGQKAAQTNRREGTGCGHGGRPREGATRARIRREPFPQAGHRARETGVGSGVEVVGLVRGKRTVTAATARSWRHRASFSCRVRLASRPK
jgi:hypothetical protein